MLEVDGGGHLEIWLLKQLKRGWVNAKTVRRGKGNFEGITAPLPLLIVHLAQLNLN